MLGAVAGDAAWQDLAAFGDIFTKTRDIFVVDLMHAIDAESADFAFGAALFLL